MLKLSLRARVLAGMAVIVVALVVVAYIVTATTRAYLIDQLDTRLAAAGGFDRVGEQRVPERPPGGFDPSGPPGRPSDVYVGVIGADGRLVTYFGDDLSGEARAVPDVGADQVAAGVSSDQPFTTGAVGDSALRYRVRARTSDDGFAVITAMPLTDVDDTMARLIVGRARRDGDDRGRPRTRHLVDRPPGHPADQADDPRRRAHRRGRPDRAGARAAPSSEAGQLGAALTTCWAGSTRRSTNRPRRRTASAGSWPTPPTSCARR